MIVEEKFKLYFPFQNVPDYCYDLIRAFKRDDFETVSDDGEQDVPLAKIVGTAHESYNRYGLRWIDMLTHGKRIDTSDFRPVKIDRILHEYRVSDIRIVRIDETGEYFIDWEGNHRISLWKLSGMQFKLLPVKTVTLRNRVRGCY